MPNTDKSDKKHQMLTRELLFLGQMLSTETAMFHHQAAAKNGLSITDSKTITVLMQEGPMTAGDLAVRLSLTTGAVTSVIDRLEAAGFAARVTDPDDRRKVIVHIRHKNLAKIGHVYGSMGAAFEELLATYSTEQLEFLVRFYRAVVEMTKQQICNLES